MHSFGKQKTNEICSRQSVVMSDLEKNECIAGKFPRSEIKEQQAYSQIEVALESRDSRHRKTNPIGEEFRYLLKPNKSAGSGISAVNN